MFVPRVASDGGDGDLGELIQHDAAREHEGGPYLVQFDHDDGPHGRSVKSLGGMESRSG